MSPGEVMSGDVDVHRHRPIVGRARFRVRGRPDPLEHRHRAGDRADVMTIPLERDLGRDHAVPVVSVDRLQAALQHDRPDRLPIVLVTRAATAGRAVRQADQCVRLRLPRSQVERLDLPFQCRQLTPDDPGRNGVGRQAQRGLERGR